MGEFKEKISKLSNSEMEEIWKKITSYQGSYIDDFLIELNVRGIRDEFFLNDYTLEDLYSKVIYSENIEYLKSLIEKRGLTSSISNTEKKKVNYTIPTAGIAILIVVIIKLLARNAGNEHKEQRQNLEIKKEQLDSQIEEKKQQNYQNECDSVFSFLFKPDGYLSLDLNDIKAAYQENKKEGVIFDKKMREIYINDQVKRIKDGYFSQIDSLLYRGYSKGLPQEMKDKILNKYISELNQILN